MVNTKSQLNWEGAQIKLITHYKCKVQNCLFDEIRHFKMLFVGTHIHDYLMLLVNAFRLQMILLCIHLIQQSYIRRGY